MVAIGRTTAYYFTHPVEILRIWEGGLGIPGAVIGGALALYIYTRVKSMSFPTWVDIIAPGLALAQAIGRWGNFVNQEVYGAPSNLPWAIYIDPAHRLPEFIDVSHYHPLFLYESLYNLLNMAILLWIGRKFAHRLRTGDIFLTYLVIYPVGRFLLEFLRLDPSPVAGVNINQTIMAVIAVAAVIALIFRHRNWQPAGPESEPPAQVEISGETNAEDANPS
jgi:phosphatidylglycerol:prolipoprotein diacylglycerol transferase